MENHQGGSQSPSIHEAYEVQRLSQLCLPRWYDRIYSRVVRPERPEFAELLTGRQANPKWTRALKILRHAINNTNCPSHNEQDEKELQRSASEKKKCKTSTSKNIYKSLLEPRSRLESFIQGLDGFEYPDDIAKPVLGAVALILYDQECTGPSLLVPITAGSWERPDDRVLSIHDLAPPSKGIREQRLLEKAYFELVVHMLLIDYPIDESPELQSRKASGHFEYPKGLIPAVLNPLAAYLTQFVNRIRNGEQDQLPSIEEWRGLAGRIITICKDSTLAPETALVLYYYHTHRHENFFDWRPDAWRPQTHDGRLTGYTGILQELITGVQSASNNNSRAGPRDRLLRKLSVDIQMFYNYWQHRRDGNQMQKIREAILEVSNSFLRKNDHLARQLRIGNTGSHVVNNNRKQQNSWPQDWCLWAPRTMITLVQTPEFEKTHRDGYPKEDWQTFLAPKRDNSLKNSLLRRPFYFANGNKYLFGGKGMGSQRRGFVCFDIRLLRSRSVSVGVSRTCPILEYTDDENARRLEKARKKIQAGLELQEREAALMRGRPYNPGSPTGVGAGASGRHDGTGGHPAPRDRLHGMPWDGTVVDGICILDGLRHGWIDKP